MSHVLEPCPQLVFGFVGLLKCCFEREIDNIAIFTVSFINKIYAQNP